MGEITQTLTVYLQSRREDIDIDVDCEYEILNDGIGPYEFHGQKCNDKGTDYLVIIGTEWDKTGFTPEEIVEVEAMIKGKISEWEGEIWINEDSNGE